MVTSAGGGYSRWKDLAVNRWREDATTDHVGHVLLPARRRERRGLVHGLPAHAAASRALRGHLQRSARRIPPARRRTSRRIPRSSSRRRTTSSCAGCASPIARARGARSRSRATPRSRSPRPPPTRCTRPSPTSSSRRRSMRTAARSCARAGRARATRRPPWMFHLMAAHGVDSADVSFETDRMALHRPRAHGRGAARDGHAADACPAAQGSVLDPIMAIRHRITLDPQQTATLDLVYGVAETREAAVALAEQVPGSPSRGPRVRPRLDAQLGDAAPDQRHRVRRAALRAARRLRHLRQRVAARGRRACSSRNRRGQSGLWSYAISGDLPIVLLQIGDADNIELVRQMVQAHAYWRLKGLAVDLVIWNEDRGGYRQRAAGPDHGADRGRGRSARHGSAGRHLRAPRRADRGRRPHPAAVGGARHRHRSARQPRRAGRAAAARAEVRIPRLATTRAPRPIRAASPCVPARARAHPATTALGGFTPDGREYVITLRPGDADARRRGATCSPIPISAA